MRMKAMRYLAAITILTLAFAITQPAVSAGAKVTISKQDCQRLLRNRARADVTFKPGVSVRGNKVTGANLHADQKIKLPKEFSFNLNIDIAKKYGLDTKGISADMVVGKVTIKGPNIYFNGKRLGDVDQTAVLAECQKTLNGE